MSQGINAGGNSLSPGSGSDHHRVYDSYLGRMSEVDNAHLVGSFLVSNDGDLRHLASRASSGGESELELAAKTIARIKELLFALGALRRLPWETIPSTELKEMSQITLGKSQAFDNPRRPTETEMIALFEKTLVGWEPSKAN